MRFVASALQMVGAVCLVVAGFLVSACVGFVVAGVVAVVGGVVVEAEVKRGSAQSPSG